SYEFWSTWFGASRYALGATLKINGTVFSVIGVAPPGFHGITVQPSEIYIPAMMARAGYRWCKDAFARDCNVFSLIGRLREGFTVEQTNAEIAALMPQSWLSAKEGENTGITAFPARGVSHPDIVRSSEVRFVELLTGVAGILLLVCCINLAGL